MWWFITILIFIFSLFISYLLILSLRRINNFENVIFGQDKRIIESQRPQKVPFDLTEELHLNFDTVAINYRLGMKALGLDY